MHTFKLLPLRGGDAFGHGVVDGGGLRVVEGGPAWVGDAADILAVAWDAVAVLIGDAGEARLGCFVGLQRGLRGGEVVGDADAEIGA